MKTLLTDAISDRQWPSAAARIIELIRVNGIVKEKTQQAIALALELAYQKGRGDAMDYALEQRTRGNE